MKTRQQEQLLQGRGITPEQLDESRHNVSKNFDPDDDFDEPLPTQQCNLDDGECESCQ
jgi:hypothetical protein